MDTQNKESEQLQVVHKLSASLNEKEWFLDSRLKAYSLLNERVAPVIERLNYMDWNLFEKFTFENTNSENHDTNLLDDLTKKGTRFDYLQKSSGAFEVESESAKEVFVYTFKEIHKKDQSLFKELYEKSEFMNFKDAFNVFNLAFLTSGLFIYIPKGVELKQAMKIGFLDERLTTGDKNHQVFIYAEENTSVEIIESYYSTKKSKKEKRLNVHVHIEAKAGSHVKYTAIDELDKYTATFFRRTGKTSRDAKIEIALGIMNDGNSIEDVQVDLIGEGSSANVKAVAISQSNQVQCANIKIINQGAYTVGNIYQHGVVLDQATLTFNGIGDVLNNAKHSDAQQESRILILSDEARADTNPLLLIDEYELTAGHAASISQVDEMQLYYLMSRGLNRVQSERLVIRGFLGSVLSVISVEEVRKTLIETIERKLSEP